MLFFSEMDVLYPPMDIYETKEKLIIELEVPGMERENLKITCVEDKIIIEGNKREKINAPALKFIRMERYSGFFKRVVKLPFKPEEKDIKGVLKNGVLRITINKGIKNIEVEEENE